MLVSLLNDKGSRLLDVTVKLLGHKRFSMALGAAIRKKGGANRAVNALLREFDLLGRLDLDVIPHIPDGWEIVLDDQIAGRLKGVWEFDVDQKLELFQCCTFDESKVVEYRELLNRFEEKVVLPAHVLDYLLENQELIPNSWKGKIVFFWGTIYRKPKDCLTVRGISWSSRDGWADCDFPVGFVMSHFAGVLAA